MVFNGGIHRVSNGTVVACYKVLTCSLEATGKRIYISHCLVICMSVVSRVVSIDPVSFAVLVVRC